MGEAAAKEPTMEDILSSIRKIIAEEGDQPTETSTSEPVLDGPVDVAEREKPSDFQHFANKFSTEDKGEKPVVSNANVPEPSAPPSIGSVASKSTTVLESKSAGSLADIAASLQARETEAEIEPEVKSLPVIETRTEPQVAPMKVEMAEAVPPTPQAAPTKPDQLAHVAPQPAKLAPQSKIEAPSPAAVVTETPKAMNAEESEFKGALMSPSSNTSVSDSFERLKRSVMDDLEAKTEAILRPMLREWLDDNLPNMVERLVREEIERVARGS